ncbi:hypothetical protein KIN20_020564 [Parelaphostrongylus tenuis]|uniref:Uncharacterized protein n=1 Tax=Parelaphostrongylus tenuis TaxID=148309 RepID=A0AAD5QTL3_PARTN|nr:hypothetical protein KIN20_020564 [Parelaphostrongylus tenuis]
MVVSVCAWCAIILKQYDVLQDTSNRCLGMSPLSLRREKKKKMKGKKKVKNVLEKKAKGLKLNQVDRRRIGKLKEKLKFKSELRENVKAELQKTASSRGRE